ncbi:hypothetical protein SAMD00019534_038220 [Acytostelium subglobosum LB1]|uniref:hypothetical protein n=1 Tax=Acytostelium subglobosum LB1 TaxID=1410327 RepID=UPI0006448801|nr:hypothetical protein SAMD00019534_038220 [Acytostelium subglobosum LB1]GAM20647.1 hypothetical protein SAMD00019534_038220 [Acytostelium subglobosum LB1]|eukprot:XP_012760168.1 hypothetical protein SAMD00019534_038220 [Acytostelium subglobosum LB1]
MTTTSKIFGVDLETIVQAQDGKQPRSITDNSSFPKNLPFILIELVNWLEHHNASNEEGLFRIPGNTQTIQDLKSAYNQGNADLDKYNQADIHTIAGLLKLYLRELPEPLFIWRYYSTFIKVIKNQDHLQRMLHLRMLVYGLPKINREVLLYLMSFLNRISLNANVNKMTSANLAMIFAPNILRHQKESLSQIMEDSSHINSIIKSLIEEISYMSKMTSHLVSSQEDVPVPKLPQSDLPSSRIDLTTEMVINQQHNEFLFARALYPYKSNGKTHLQFSKNDMITLLDIKSEDGWMKGEFSGRVGYFPASFVEIVATPPPTTPQTLLSISEVDEQLHVSLSSSCCGNNNGGATGNTVTNTPTSLSILTSSSLCSYVISIPTLSSSSSASPNKQSPTLESSGEQITSPLMSSSSDVSSTTPLASQVATPTVMSETRQQQPTVSHFRKATPHATLMLNLPLPPPPPPEIQLTSPKSLNLPPPPSAFSCGESLNTSSSLLSISSDSTSGSCSFLVESLQSVSCSLQASSQDVCDLKEMSSEFKSADICRKRKERAEEMLRTEKTYVKQLSVIYELFIEPSKRTKSFALSDELLNVFSCLEVIINAHRAHILKALDERMLIWDECPRMGDIFCNNTSFIKLYKHYVNNYDKSIASLQQCKDKNAEFRNFVKSLDYSDRLSGLNVESFLILPVQRIPRYVLLLQDLLKYTSSSHEDYVQLNEALCTIKDFAETINFKKSEADNYLRIQQLQDQIKDLPRGYAFDRRKRLVHEGLLQTSKKEKLYVYLFSDALILTKPGKDKNRFKLFINLQTTSLNTTDDANVIKIISQEGTIKFQCDNAKDRELWTRTLKETIEAARQEMIQSAFGATLLSLGEGSKGFNKIQDEKNALKKKKLAEDLCSSELEYVQALTYTQTVFLGPIRRSLGTSAPLVSYADGLDICSNFETLLNCHTTFAEVLKERVQDWDNKPILSDLFIEKAAFLKLYNYYVQNHNLSLSTIESCVEKSQNFAIYLRNIEFNEKAELKHLLAEPLRRISRYYLILQEFLQLTRPKQDDHDNLLKVVAKLKEQNDTYTISTMRDTSGASGKSSPHKSKSMRVKPPKLSKEGKINQTSFFAV